MENLRDEFPPEYIETLPALPVGEAAIMGLSGFDDDIQRVYDDAALLDKLENERQFLDAAMETLCEGWEFEDDEAEHFRVGFALTYAAIANEAELHEIELDDIDETVLDAVTGNILLTQSGGMEYMQRSLENLESINSSLTDGWIDYLEANRIESGDPNGNAFIIGGIMAHDLLCEYANRTVLLETYHSSVN
jgi:hypothetical protein